MLVTTQRVLACGFLLALWGPSAPAQTTATASESPAKPNAALQEFLGSYTAAFAEGNAEKLAPMWAEDAEWESTVTGERANGRAAIIDDFKAFFAENPGAHLLGSIDSCKQVAPGVVCMDGQTELSIGSDEPTFGTFHAVLTATGDTWQLTKVIESAPPALEDSYAKLAPLGGLVGQWQDDSEGPQVNTTIRWGDNETFLIRTFTIDDEDQSSQGTQVIGWDPQMNRIRSWSFYSDGSFGDGAWSSSGDEWIGRLSQTLPDGTTCSGTQIIRVVDENTLEVENVGREIDGEPLPSLPPVRMIRVIEAVEAMDSADVSAAATDDATTSEKE